MAKEKEVKPEAPKEKEAPKAPKAKEPMVPFLNRHKPMGKVVDPANGDTYIQDGNVFSQNGKFLRKA
jgi:hypothetical protein